MIASAPMGLLDNLLGGGDQVMSGDAFFFMDDDAKKLRFCQEGGQRMAPAIGGTVKVRDGGDEVHVTGRFGQFSARAVIWVTFANIRITVKTGAELEVPFGGIHLQFDEEAAKHAGEQLDRDEWDDDSEQKFFLSQRVYMEGDKDELRASKTKWEQLPGELTGQLIHLMEATNKSGTFFRISEEEIEIYLNTTEITLSKNAAHRLASVLQLLTGIATAARQRWSSQADAQQFSPQPQMGPPMGPPPVAPPALAPGSPVLVAWSDGNRYPATVVQMASGQVLCAFPNGQQQWVGSNYVMPA